MFIDLAFDKSKHLLVVENPEQSVNKDRYLRLQDIVVYCYS